MQTRKRFFLISVFFLLTIALSGSAFANTITLEHGKSTTLYLPGSVGSRYKVTWSSSNKKVATVSRRSNNTCIVKAKKVGKCTIKAKYRGKTSKVTFKVTRNDSDIIKLLNKKVKKYHKSNRVSEWHRSGNYLICNIGRPLGDGFFFNTFKVNRSTGKVTTSYYYKELKIPKSFKLW